MMMGTTDMNEYPKCTKLIMGLQVKLKTNHKVLQAFLRACTAPVQIASKPQETERIARTALRFSTPPLIDVTTGVVRGIARGQPFFGCGWNDPWGPHNTVIIRITSLYFDAFEHGIHEPQRWANRIERTLLHELVHWVRGKAGAEEEALTGPIMVAPGSGQQPGKRVEAGHWFEEMAYGVFNVCTHEEFEAALRA